MKKLVALFALLLPVYANATVITYGFNVEYSGATAPEGPTPWATVTFDDGGVAGSVDMTLTAVNLLDGEHIKNLFLNMEPVAALDLNAVSYSNATLDISENGHFLNNKGGYFDIYFDFKHNELYQGDSFTATFFGDSITANNFAKSSYDNDGEYGYHVASHIGGVGQDNDNNDSGWVTDGKVSVPEPTSVALMGLGLLGMGVAARRRRKL